MDNGERKGFIIAIDGPVASGKGTIAPLLAEKLAAFYMNTGALFRMLALFATENRIALSEEELLRVYQDIVLNLDDAKALLNGEDVSDKIANAEISKLSSVVAGFPHLHEKVIAREREIGNEKVSEGTIVIAEGRNIGSAVFPDADLKVYMTATINERAERRFKQSEARGERITLDEVVEATKIRDQRDTARDFYPLVAEPEKHGYYVLDNTGLNQEQTLQKIMDELRRKELINDSN